MQIHFSRCINTEHWSLKVVIKFRKNAFLFTLSCGHLLWKKENIHKENCCLLFARNKNLKQQFRMIQRLCTKSNLSLFWKCALVDAQDASDLLLPNFWKIRKLKKMENEKFTEKTRRSSFNRAYIFMDLGTRIKLFLRCWEILENRWLSSFSSKILRPLLISYSIHAIQTQSEKFYIILKRNWIYIIIATAS